MLWARRLIGAFFKSDHAAVKQLRAFHGFDDLHEHDLMRRPSERKAAAAPFRADENSPANQLLEDLGHEITWEVRAGDKLVQQHIAARRASGEFRNATDRVLSLVG